MTDQDRHDEIPADHLKDRVHKVCPACFHNWLALKDAVDPACPMCRDRAVAEPGPCYPTCVLQDWVMKLTWKMQSILFSSLRGPDQEYLVNIKQVSKWMRSVTQSNADPSKPYMSIAPGNLPQVEALYKELEHCPCHFVHHFLDGLAIIAYHHPDEHTAFYAAQVHYKCAEELFHFYPEPPEWFKVRHRDKRNGVDPFQNKWAAFENNQKLKFFQETMLRFKVKIK